MLSIPQVRQALAQNRSIRDVVRENLETTLIEVGQFDPNGLCNAKCWFCPVKYHGNPAEFVNQLSPEQVDQVLANIRSSSLIAQNKFDFMYTAHYNEVLLYKHFEEMVESFRKHGFRTMVLSNGTPLVPSKTDLIARHRDVITDVCLNIPGIELDDWAEKAGFDPKIHKILLRNLDYFHEQLPVPCQVLVNCITEYFAGDLKQKGMFVSKAKAQEIVQGFKDRWPKFTVTLVEQLVDRSGSLDAADVLKNYRAQIKPTQRVIGCSHDMQRNSRIYGWIHVNSKADVFLCCDDYDMEYKFGNLLEQSLDEIWLSERHVDVICDAFERICRKCVHHVV